MKRLLRSVRSRLRPQFRLRSLGWLILVTAILACWYRDRQRLRSQIDALQNPRSDAWSVIQILGPPDTLTAGDHATAWATRQRDSGTEWVIVEYPESVAVSCVAIYESYNPGAVCELYTVSSTGREELIWKGDDPMLNGKPFGVAHLVPGEPTTTRRIKVVLDTTRVAGWNEIDAVALIDARQGVHWASDAWASSSYGFNRPAPRWFWP